MLRRLKKRSRLLYILDKWESDQYLDQMLKNFLVAFMDYKKCGEALGDKAEIF